MAARLAPRNFKASGSVDIVGPAWHSKNRPALKTQNLGYLGRDLVRLRDVSMVVMLRPFFWK